MSNYKKGRALEYKARDDLEKMGYFVVRSAGSHGQVDLVALKRVTMIGPDVMLVQCKANDNGKPSSEKKALVKLAHLISLSIHCNVQPIWWSNNNKLRFLKKGGQY